MLSIRDEVQQQAAYSLEQHMQAYYTWAVLARLKHPPFVHRFFELNAVRLRAFQRVLDEGHWTPEAAKSFPLFASDTLAEIASRFGELKLDPDEVYSAPGNQRLVIVRATKTDRRQAFARASGTGEDTAWKPVDGYSSLLPEWPLQLIEPTSDQFVRNHDELLMSWWLSGSYWEQSSHFGLPVQSKQPDTIARALTRKSGRARGVLKSLVNADAANDLIATHRATITSARLTNSEMDMLDSRATEKALQLPDIRALAAWRIYDAVWLELATMFSIPGLRRAPGFAPRKVLVGTPEQLDEAEALLTKFSSLYDYSGPLYASFSIYREASGALTNFDLVYYVITWITDSADLEREYNELADKVEEFQKQRRPFVPQMLELVYAWIIDTWYNSQRLVQGNAFEQSPSPLFYWSQHNDDYKARPGAEVKIISAVNPLRHQFKNALLPVFQPMVVPVPFTFLYYAQEPVALKLLEPNNEQRTELSNILKALTVQLQETGPVARLRAEGEPTLWTSLASLASLQATVNRNAASSAVVEITDERLEIVRQQFRKMLLTELSIASSHSLDNDQALLAPLYQRVFYIWFGTEAYKLYERASHVK